MTRPNEFIIYMAKMSSMPSFYIEFDIREKKCLDNKAAKNNIRKGSFINHVDMAGERGVCQIYIPIIYYTT